MPFSDEHKCIFVHIPKTGGTSIENLLGMDRASNLYHRRNKVDGVPPQHLPIGEIRKKVGEEKYLNYFKFTFIRNPYDRMVSEFFYRRKMSWFPKIPNMRWDSFREFMENVFVKLKDAEDWQEIRRGKFDAHLETQISFLGDMDIHEHGWQTNELNFLGKYEFLQQEFDRICKLDLGIEPQTLQRWNESEHLTYTHYYDSHTKKLLEDNYKEDIEIFRYTYE
jgi:hypothetical protein